jgi:hypothetical protein
MPGQVALSRVSRPRGLSRLYAFGRNDGSGLGFEGAEPEATGRPAYHPATMLKIYIYGYLNRIQSSRRLEGETQRNVETDLPDGPADARLQDDCGLPPRQR